MCSFYSCTFVGRTHHASITDCFYCWKTSLLDYYSSNICIAIDYWTNELWEVMLYTRFGLIHTSAVVHSYVSNKFYICPWSSKHDWIWNGLVFQGKLKPLRCLLPSKRLILSAPDVHQDSCPRYTYEVRKNCVFLLSFNIYLDLSIP